MHVELQPYLLSLMSGASSGYEGVCANKRSNCTAGNCISLDVENFVVVYDAAKEVLLTVGCAAFWC